MSQSKRVRGEHVDDRQQMQPSPSGSDQEGEVASHLPLSALLSQVLVAFTIEFDNEFEHQMPHRTTSYGSRTNSSPSPWLTSLVMWSNCMQFVSEEGVTVSELQRLARTGTNLAGMLRWRYITVEPDPSASRSKQPLPNAVIRPTPGGRKAQEVWRPLFGVIEERWRERFGKDEIDQLRESLWALISQVDIMLPDCLPILSYGLFNIKSQSGEDDFLGRQVDDGQRTPAASGLSHLSLLTLLSRVLLTFAIEFERESNVSLAISANVLRVLSGQGVQLRDLPSLTGVSKESISMAMGILQERHLGVVEPDPAGSRFKVVHLTPKGQKARKTYSQLLDTIEQRWRERFGEDEVGNLRILLERLVGEPSRQLSPLFKGLEPYPDGWRASVRKPDTLPYYPMVLHRGGYPDGS